MADLSELIEALVRAEFGIIEPIAPDTDLRDDLVIDSLAKVELAMVIEDDLDIGLSDQAVADVRTFGELCALVNRLVASRRYDQINGQVG